ncbi:hypothetical protein [Pseudogemmobacter bohemicus]|uniref:hypothetical protein n=1 Tax=Pseudogemmobacter bohemicus TaxID=2250708 RepID=UPI000DD2BBBD|nr:hypothetical protein [Pseudogemmobacter bohemicus]
MSDHLHSPTAKAELQAWLAPHNAVAAADEAAAETIEELAALPLWQVTSTTAKAVSLTQTGAAIVPQSPLMHSHVPRRKGWQKIITKLAKGGGPLAVAILRDAEFWHHQSRNARWNADLGRYERWCVRSVPAWLDQLQEGENRPAERSFHRAKDYLVSAGLIIAEAHFWEGKRCLWMKPSPETTRIMFEPGYWEGVADTWQAVGKRKPRGNSAAHAAYTAEAEAWYQKSRDAGLPPDMTSAERWAVFKRLTEPQALSGSYTIAAFAPKGSTRYAVLQDMLLP